MQRILKGLAVGLMLTTTHLAGLSSASAQTDTNTDTATSEVDPASLLTQAELENLVAPVALYPDTLLIQVLVAATYPLQIVKADKFVKDNAGLEQDALSAAIESEAYDESVAVLATAFPDVLSDMADNVDWTDTIGTAMLAQSDDVLAAVQTMRNQAINTGALISGPEQTVSVDEGAVIVQPTDPQVVYVPQYNTETVYVQDNSNDVLVNTLIIFGTIALIDNIFDNNNSWHGYWGCRNCGGWNGRPIYRNPDIDIDIDGNVNIGNNVNLGNRPDRRPDGGWQPEPRRQQEARNKISNKRGPDGATKLPVRKTDARGDQLRNQLSSKTGVADISRDKAARASVNRPSTRPASSKKDAISRTARNPTPGKARVKPKAPVRKPSARPATRKPAARAPAKRQPSAMKQRAPSHQSRAASSRGRSSGGGGRRGRR